MFIFVDEGEQGIVSIMFPEPTPRIFTKGLTAVRLRSSSGLSFSTWCKGGSADYGVNIGRGGGVVVV